MVQIAVIVAHWTFSVWDGSGLALDYVRHPQASKYIYYHKQKHCLQYAIGFHDFVHLESVRQFLPCRLQNVTRSFLFSVRYINIVHNVNYVPISMVADTKNSQHKSDYINVANKAPIKADSRLASSQWETSLQSNAVSHWLGANLEPAYDRSRKLHQRKAWPGNKIVWHCMGKQDHWRNPQLVTSGVFHDTWRIPQVSFMGLQICEWHLVMTLWYNI